MEQLFWMLKHERSVWERNWKYSEASKRLIEARAGTRHTSAQRFSYDFAKGIIFVVSSDGPVTVFSDGMSVTDLEVRLLMKHRPSPEESFTPEVAFSLLLKWGNLSGMQETAQDSGDW